MHVSRSLLIASLMVAIHKLEARVSLLQNSALRNDQVLSSVMFFTCTQHGTLVLQQQLSYHQDSVLLRRIGLQLQYCQKKSSIMTLVSSRSDCQIRRSRLAYQLAHAS